MWETLLMFCTDVLFCNDLFNFNPILRKLCIDQSFSKGKNMVIIFKNFSSTSKDV
jgi:hypothetical protein